MRTSPKARAERRGAPDEVIKNAKTCPLSWISVADKRESETERGSQRRSGKSHKREGRKEKSASVNFFFVIVKSVIVKT